MSVKNNIQILNSLNLTKVESELLKVNIKLLACDYLCVKKVAIQGIKDLLNQVNFRYFLLKYSL